MKVILLENLENLGQIGDIVNVKDGYARNYLLPKKLVARADPRKIKQFEHDKQRAEKKLQRLRKEAQQIADKIQGIKFTYERKISEEGKLFGSVSITDILKSLKENGFEINKSQIELKNPIKQLGVFQIIVRFDREVKAEIEVEVLAEKQDAEG